MKYDELSIYARSMNIKGSNKDIIPIILSIEFPDANIDYVPKVDINQMKAVLRTLDEDQIHVIAYSSGVKKPEKRGKNRNIELILYKKFPLKQIKKIKQLSVGRNVSNWSYPKRMDELNKMSTQDLKTLALTFGLDLQKGVGDPVLIKRILSQEEYIAKLIPKEDKDKEEIIKNIAYITGSLESTYRLWSLSELEIRLEYLRNESQEYWIEMEHDRLYTKLSQIVDINKNKYSNAKSWKLKKLRNELKKVAGSEWESYRPLLEDHSFVECMSKQQQYEWIEGKITGVWLSGPEGGDPKSEYVFKDISIEEDGHTWYKANRKFFSLQCNDYKKDRVQNGDILTSYTQAGKPVNLMVGYTLIGWKHDQYKSRTHMVDTDDGRRVQRTFIIQDEIMFNKEKRFSLRNNQMEHERIQDILNSTVSERTSKSIMDIISKSLLEIAPMKKDYGIIRPDTSGMMNKTIDSHTPYIQILVDTLRDSPEQTNNEFFTKAASLLVFINMPEAKTFRNNLEMEYYLPDILATLSPYEKFPEAFRDPNASGKFLEELTASITNRIYKLVMELAKSEYKSQEPTRRIKPDHSISIYHSIKTRKRLDACSNKDRVNGVKDEEIVYYNEDGNIYCFSVDELYEQLLIQNDIINPDTGNQFDPSFVKRFDELYNKRLADDGLLTGYFQKKYGFDMGELVNEKIKVDTIKSKRPIIVVNLWDIIGKDISELEDQLSNEKAVDGDEIDEDRETERREEEVEQGIQENIEIDPNDVCEYCKNHLSDDSIKSIILHGEESRIIKFCSFKCFEDKNDWSKFKAKRSKKKPNKKSKKQKKTKNDSKVSLKRNFVDNEKEVVKLSKEEQKKRKKLIKKQLKEGVASFDKVAFPLMNTSELREIAKEKDIKIPGGLTKMDIASFLYKKIHPKSTKGVFNEKTAKKEMIIIETRREKKKRKRNQQS
jgi:hypothetical protein